MNDRLRSWTKHHLNHRNIFLKNLKNIEDSAKGFNAELTNKSEEYIIIDNLEFENLDKEKNTSIVCMNTNKNFQKLLSEWKIIVAYENLRIIFIEKINSNKYWQIKPFHHDKIADKKTFKAGLKSLFDSAKN